MNHSHFSSIDSLRLSHNLTVDESVDGNVIGVAMCVESHHNHTTPLLGNGDTVLEFNPY